MSCTYQVLSQGLDECIDGWGVGAWMDGQVDRETGGRGHSEMHRWVGRFVGE